MSETPVSPHHSTPLRIGLYVHAMQVPAWAHHMVETIVRSSIAEVVLLVLDESPPDNLSGRMSAAARLLYRLYTGLDRRIFRVGRDAAAPADLKSLLPDCPVMPVRPEISGNSARLTDEAVGQIQSADLDVLVFLGSRPLTGAVLAAPRYGVWAHTHCDTLRHHGVLPGLWEVAEAYPVTGSTLHILSDNPQGGTTIYRTYGATHKLSLRRSLNLLLWRSSDFVIRKLTDLYNSGPAALHDPLGDDYRPYSHPLYGLPTAAQMLGILLKMLYRIGHEAVARRFTIDQWVLGYDIQPGRDTPAESFHQFRVIKPPKDRFLADPFVVRRGDRFYIFVEDYPYSTERGHLAVLEMDMQGRYTDPRPILQKDYHLSYPFIFQWNGDDYMIPETHENRTVDLYKCTAFPDKWEFVKTLIPDLRAVDATVFEKDGRWWMFVSVDEFGPLHDELYIFSSDSLLGTWTPHPQNPVKSDIRSARPAGHVFKRGDTYYRPSQDCSVTYGYAIVINRIDRLDEQGYRETEITRIYPQWHPGLSATHTLNHAGELTIVDGFMRRWRF